MAEEGTTREQVLEAIVELATKLGRTPARSEFSNHSGIRKYWVLLHFGNWNDAVVAAGLAPNTYSKKLEKNDLLADWGRVVRHLRRIPTRMQYGRAGGNHSVSTFDKAFRSWSRLPALFREFAGSNPGWEDVVALLPSEAAPPLGGVPEVEQPRNASESALHPRLKDRPTYGNPIDFRGLRHEPVNEQGVVFLFGMLARELGYHVEAVQTGFPDCEAKRQVADGSWQRVRIEFEYESRNFRDHGHAVDGCDVIVCWRHNWAECPAQLEILELRLVIRTLATGDD